jgi:hypothetical protein
MLALVLGMFWFAKDFSVRDMGLDLWLDPILVPWIEKFGLLVHLDRIRDGKVLAHLIKGVPDVADGAILLLYSGLFVGGLVFLKIIPVRSLRQIVRSGDVAVVLAKQDGHNGGGRSA